MAARGDFGFGLVWLVLGAGAVVESWRMDRLEAQGINPYTAPGLLPGLLGAVMVVLGAALAVRGWRGRVGVADRAHAQPREARRASAVIPAEAGIHGADGFAGGEVDPRFRGDDREGGRESGDDGGEGEADSAAPRHEVWRVGLALLLCLGFGFGLLGSGVPFWAAAFLFLFLAVLLFELPDRLRDGTLARGAALALAVAAGGSAFATLVFQELFLVRLP